MTTASKQRGRRRTGRTRRERVDWPGRLLARLKTAGARGIALEDVIELTCSASDLRAWLNRLHRDGWPVAWFRDPAGENRYRLVGGRRHTGGQSNRRCEPIGNWLRREALLPGGHGGLSR